MKSKRWIRWLVLFGIVPLIVPWLAFKTGWQIRIWLASRTPGLSAKTIVLDGGPYRYGVVEPVAGKFDGPRPLVVFLHSATECGTDGVLPARKIPAAFLAYAREQAGALIMLPQFPGHDQGWNSGWHPLVLRLIEQVKQDYAVDARQVYLVGMSLGGRGCWDLAADRPDLFAAAVPICGNGSPEELASRLTVMAIWAFHGSDDQAIPVSGSRDLVAAIKQAGGDNVRYSEYTGVGHNCWDRALSDPELLDWLFQQRQDVVKGPLSR